MQFEDHLWIPTKVAYVRGDEKPKVDCILCSIRDGDPRVRSLEVWRNNGMIAVLNLYPYNPGHLMVFPYRHVFEPSELKDEEVTQLFASINMAIHVLKKCYSPKGFNIGFNIGKVSGASIPHLHAHIVPRYDNELGFIDVIGGSRIIIENPETYQKKIHDAFMEIQGEEKA